jgi:arsenate reductase
MKEIGIDISEKKTNSVFDLFKQGKMFKYVITVCDETAAERCPIFPGVAERISWSFPDPSALKGDYSEKLKGTRNIRDEIKEKIEGWIDEMQ